MTMPRRVYPLPQIRGVDICQHVRVFEFLAVAGWNPVVLRREELNDQNIGPIFEDLQTEQPYEWKDIAEDSLTYKSYWTQ
jgi:hypothetical protein